MGNQNQIKTGWQKRWELRRNFWSYTAGLNLNRFHRRVHCAVHLAHVCTVHYWICKKNTEPESSVLHTGLKGSQL